MPRVPSDTAQLRMLVAFDELCDELGRAPSVRELSKRLGMHPLGATRTLNHLMDDGWILTAVRTTRIATRLSAAGRRRLAQADTRKAT